MPIQPSLTVIRYVAAPFIEDEVGNHWAVYNTGPNEVTNLENWVDQWWTIVPVRPGEVEFSEAHARRAALHLNQRQSELNYFRNLIPLYHHLAQAIRRMTAPPAEGVKGPTLGDVADAVDEILDEIDSVAEYPMPNVEALLEDASLLDFLQSQTRGYGSGWVLRESTSGRGMRLHEDRSPLANPDVRQAIDRLRPLPHFIGYETLAGIVAKQQLKQFQQMREVIKRGVHVVSELANHGGDSLGALEDADWIADANKLLRETEQ